MTVIGLGPGTAGLLPPMALHCLIQAQAVVGYDRYVDLVDPGLLQGKTLFSSPMKKEMERTQKAVQLALDGMNTVVVSSGDSGIYGMAGLVLEYLERWALVDRIDLQIIPGIPALCAAAALLGAPLMHDFACVSLSDLLTPLPTIMKRIWAAAEADFVLVLYNPKSRRRSSYLADVLDIVARQRGPQTPVGFVRNAFRQDQEVLATTLESCDPDRADMLTIVIVGNSASRLVSDKILTPRGYFEKYGV